MQVAPQLRPLDLGDILDGSFRLYRNNFVTFLGVVALLIVPVALLRLVLALVFGNPAAQLGQFQGLSGMPSVPGAEWLAVYSAYANAGANGALGLLDSFVIEPLVTAALVYAIARRYMSLPVTLTEAVRFGVKKLLYLVAAVLLLNIGSSLVIVVPIFCILFLTFGLLIGAGAAAAGGSSSGALAAAGLIGVGFGGLVFVGLLIGLAWLYAQLAFYPQALVVEGLGPIDALRRSWRLTGGQRWRTTGIYMLLYLLWYVLSLIFLVLLGGLGLGVGLSLRDPLSNYGLIVGITEVVQLLSSLVLQPFLLIGLTLLYYDLRVRKEGLDLELQAAAAMPHEAPA